MPKLCKVSQPFATDCRGTAAARAVKHWVVNWKLSRMMKRREKNRELAFGALAMTLCWCSDEGLTARNASCPFSSREWEFITDALKNRYDRELPPTVSWVYSRDFERAASQISTSLLISNWKRSGHKLRFLCEKMANALRLLLLRVNQYAQSATVPKEKRIAGIIMRRYMKRDHENKANKLVTSKPTNWPCRFRRLLSHDSYRQFT